MYWPDRLAAAVYVPFVPGEGTASYGLDTLEMDLDVNGGGKSSNGRKRQSTNERKGESVDGSIEDAANVPRTIQQLKTLSDIERHFDGFHRRMEERARCTLDLEVVVEEFESSSDPRLGM